MTTPVVMLPSLGRGASDFDALLAALHAEGFTAPALEPPTSMPEGSTLHDLADLVVAAIDARGWQRVHLLGHAFGQRLARCVVADHPDRVASLVMLCAGGLVDMDPQLARSLVACFDQSLTPDEHLAHVQRVFFAAGNDPTVWADGWLPATARVQQTALHATPPGEWTSAAARRVLVVQGLRDVCAVPENGRRYVAMHPHIARLVEIDDAGHALLPEQPAAVAAAVVEFLREE